MTVLSGYVATSTMGTRGAMAQMARDLMRGDPGTFKVGYTAENALLAVCEQAEREGIATTGDDRAAVAAAIGADTGSRAVARAIAGTEG